ncbi:MAG: hypothetical protein NPMRTH4_2220001 [Nitrosopumilales archaeon]|nr:MAG: hypothetical protein NPMRTH4_2220001 [Nitrosopumilales archaeon]
MNKTLIFSAILIIFAPMILNAFAEQTYLLSIDEHTFELEYELTGDLIAMALDQELTSLLIGIENTKDSVFSINLPQEMITSENNEFAVLVNGLEVDYELELLDNEVVLKFFVPDGTQEIEIIGTRVIPEFPFGGILGFVSMISVGILLTKLWKTRLK